MKTLKNKNVKVSWEIMVYLGIEAKDNRYAHGYTVNTTKIQKALDDIGRVTSFTINAEEHLIFKFKVSSTLES